MRTSYAVLMARRFIEIFMIIPQLSNEFWYLNRMQQRIVCFSGTTTKPPLFRRLFHLNSLGCQGAARRKCIQGYPAGKMYYLFTIADIASTDIPTIKKEHELSNRLSLHRISGIDTIPKFVD